MRPKPLLTLFTDFGGRDPFVGIMKGVILGICREVVLVDLCHEVPAHDVLRAGFVLQAAVQPFPAGTIHVAVVDPGVGGARRPILAEIDDQVFVAPDNGLLSHVLASGERWRVRHLTATEFWRHPVSVSFHGRDIFAPVAGHLATGVEPARFGPEIRDPVRLEIPRPGVDAAGCLRGVVMWVDRFGNCITNVSQEDIQGIAAAERGSIRIHAGGRDVGRLVDHFGAVAPGDTGAIMGSAGYLELFSNQGNLAREWSLGAGDQVVLQAAAVR